MVRDSIEERFRPLLVGEREGQLELLKLELELEEELPSSPGLPSYSSFYGMYQITECQAAR